LSVSTVARSRVMAVLFIAALAVSIALFARAGTASAASTGVVINEVYGGGGNTNAPYQNDFIELRNLSSSPVDLSNDSIQYDAATGTTYAYYVTDLTGSIPANGLYLIQEAAGTTETGAPALPTPQTTGTINLSATAGRVALVSNTTALAGTATPTSPGVIDFVGYGSTASQSETSPAPAPSNTASDQRTGADTDNNSTDFIVAAPTPGAANATSGSGSTGGCTTAGAITVDDITSDAWLSPYDGMTVSCVAGVVTGIRTSGSSLGYWIQQVTGVDSDPATSEGIFVYTSSAPTNVAAGDSVLVSGNVSNYDPEGNRSTKTTDDLDVTEIGSPTTVVLSHNNALPAPVVLDPTTGTNPVPNLYAPDLSGTSDDNIEDTPITPTRSALDYYRSIEGMRVEVDNAPVVGPSAVYGSGATLDSESYITSKPTQDTDPRGGTLLEAENATPSGRLELVPDNGSNPALSVGDVLTGATIGTIDYSEYGGYVVASTQLGTINPANVVTPTVVPTATTNQLSMATYNVENLAPSDPASKYSALGTDLVTNLASPDIVAVEEVQDNDGATDDGVVAADQTIAKLTAAISAAGGPSYSSEEIDPVNDQDGGEPGGNIRVVYLYNPAVVSFVPGTMGAGDSTTATAVTTVNGQPALTLSPGRIDPSNVAWTSSRKPLAAEFMFQGNPVFTIANHFVAKLGDQDQDGRFQYPMQSSATQRAQQATEVHNFTQSILNVNPNANVVVLGDLNDYQFSPALKTLETGTADGSGTSILQDLITTLPVNQQYTYDYEGVSEVLDHILVSPALQGKTQYTVAHINSEFTNQTSDHDPQVVDLTLPAVTTGATNVRTVLSPTTVAANGTSTSTVTATVTNAAGVGVTSNTVSFSSSDPGVTFGPVTADANGDYSATLTSSKVAGPVTITATDSSVTPSVSGQATLTETAVATTPVTTTTTSTPPATPPTSPVVNPVAPIVPAPTPAPTTTGASITLPASFGSAQHPLTALSFAPTFGAGVEKVVYTLNKHVICTDTKAPFACHAKLTGAYPGLAKLVITVTATNGTVTSLTRIVHIARIRVKGLSLSSKVSRGRLVLSGKLTLPSNVTVGQGCSSGTVKVGAGKHVVKAKLTRSCSYSGSLTGIRRGTKLTASFSGNRALAPARTTAKAR
jgi:predicted extracellular nuclease